jgi:hypothetical protein
MSKYGIKFIREHLNLILEMKFQYSDVFLMNYLSKIPNRFYKYRSCNKDYFNALENDYIWMSTADYFDDRLDSTLNYNLEIQASKIGKTIKERLPEILLSAITKELKNRSIKIPDVLNLEFITWMISEFLYSNGDFKSRKFRVIC